MLLLPPFEQAARLESGAFQTKALCGLPELEVNEFAGTTRRGFLGCATAALAASCAQSAHGQLVFSPKDPEAILNGTAAPEPAAPEHQAPGHIPPDFWQRPRELWMRRHGTRDEIKVVYWQDGRLLSEGYWRACALLRDVRANVMTAIDPTVLDILRGIIGYYQAWEWPFPIVATSGYRTVKTNNALSKEGAARNSMHLYGKAVDLFIPGIPTRDVGALALYLQQGGVGFYPDKGFTHLDTGRLRVWRG